MRRAALLLVSDPAYPAQGRRYGDEDVWLASRLRERFDVALCSPLDAAALLDRFDVVLVRNSGPVVHYREAWDAFRAAAAGRRVVNPLHGRGDQAGKDYLVELTAAGAPVIPTARPGGTLPEAGAYVVKPRLGADSIGLAVVADPATAAGDVIVQPRLELVEEVSFVFVGRSFHYALRTTTSRWRLEPFTPSDADLAFAQRFVDWNALDIGVQRVDGARTADGQLLLVELEDLNPYLSLDVLDDATREVFVAALAADLDSLLTVG